MLITSESVEYRTILSNMEEKTPTISPDQGATGETASSTKNMDVGMQTSLSEKERETQYRKHYAEGIFKLLELFERLHGKGYDEVIKNKEELLDQVLDFVLLLLQYAKVTDEKERYKLKVSSDKTCVNVVHILLCFMCVVMFWVEYHS